MRINFQQAVAQALFTALAMSKDSRGLSAPPRREKKGKWQAQDLFKITAEGRVYPRLEMPRDFWQLRALLPGRELQMRGYFDGGCQKAFLLREGNVEG